MPNASAGILAWRRGPHGGPEVLLAHMGGPFWSRKDDGAWSIVKGEHGLDEPAWDAARREWTEETGWPAPDGVAVELGEVRTSKGKRVVAWAVEAPQLDPATLQPGLFELEWPPRSGKKQFFPEVDRVAWFDLPTARRKLVVSQAPFLDRLADRTAG